jgi:hypothetical protein
MLAATIDNGQGPSVAARTAGRCSAGFPTAASPRPLPRAGVAPARARSGRTCPRCCVGRRSATIGAEKLGEATRLHTPKHSAARRDHRPLQATPDPPRTPRRGTPKPAPPTDHRPRPTPTPRHRRRDRPGGILRRIPNTQPEPHGRDFGTTSRQPGTTDPFESSSAVGDAHETLPAARAGAVGSIRGGGFTRVRSRRAR